MAKKKAILVINKRKMAYSKELKKVWKATKKPSKKEYFLTCKIVIVGFLIIGLIGFIMELINIFFIKRLFS